MIGTFKEPDYAELWASKVIKEEDQVKALADKIRKGQSRYEVVAEAAAKAIPNGSICPWQVIGIIHCLECSLSWTKHLHNGDPLSARTIHVPAGRPRRGEPPFTWEQSAIDAIRMIDFNNADYDWSKIPFVLKKLEEYNGTGYQGRGIYSPYLWSFTNHYTKGKYAADGEYDPNLVSKQIGAAPLLSLLL